MKNFLSVYFIFMSICICFSHFESLHAQTIQEKQKSIEKLPETKLKQDEKKKNKSKKISLKTKELSPNKISAPYQPPKSIPIKHTLPVNIDSLGYDKMKIGANIKQKKEIIFIDAGHGANDEGAKVSGCMEKNLCLLTSLHLRNLLQSKGYHIIMTRSHDEYVTLDKRVEMANESGCHLFVSIHYNSAKSKDASGVEIFYPKHQDIRQTTSKKLAQNVLNKMIGKTGAKSRGVKAGNFHVIRETKMPAILVEGGFITHPIEGQHLTSLNYIQKLSEGIAEGIENFLQVNL